MKEKIEKKDDEVIERELTTEEKNKVLVKKLKGQLNTECFFCETNHKLMIIDKSDVMYCENCDTIYQFKKNQKIKYVHTKSIAEIARFGAENSGLGTRTFKHIR